MATKKSASKKSASTSETAAPVKAPAKKAAAKSVSATADTKPKAAAKQKSPASHEEVAKLAHSYWEERGRPHGGHNADWLRAEKHLNS